MTPKPQSGLSKKTHMLVPTGRRVGRRVRPKRGRNERSEIEAGLVDVGEPRENCAELPTAADFTKPEMDLSAFDATRIVSVEAP